MKPILVFLAIFAFLMGMGRTEQEEKELDSKATESQQVRVAKVDLDNKDKRLQAAKVMLVPQVSLMVAVPHPSGRFLMLFPTSSHIVPVMPMPYIHHDHPAMFAARQQLLYNGPSNYQHQSQHQPREFHNQQLFNNGYLRRLPIDVN